MREGVIAEVVGTKIEEDQGVEIGTDLEIVIEEAQGMREKEDQDHLTEKIREGSRGRDLIQEEEEGAEYIRFFTISIQFYDFRYFYTSIEQLKYIREPLSLGQFINCSEFIFIHFLLPISLVQIFKIKYIKSVQFFQFLFFNENMTTKFLYKAL